MNKILNTVNAAVLDIDIANAYTNDITDIRTKIEALQKDIKINKKKNKKYMWTHGKRR